MDMRLQHILTRQHTPTLRSIGLRMYSRHTVTAAESASGLGTITTLVTAATTAVMEDIQEVMAATTVATVGIQVAMVAILEIMAVTTADMAATTESMELRPFIPAG